MSGKSLIRVTDFVRKLRGVSQPILVQASDGFLYVLKFTDPVKSPQLSFNEGMGSEVYSACGLPTPSWEPLEVTPAFLDRNPGCWFEDGYERHRPEPGICFGSRFLGNESLRVFEILPATRFSRIRNRESFWLAWLLDICANHADRRQALFLEPMQGQLAAVFLDHGHLFGGPGGDSRSSLLESRYVDARIYDRLPRGAWYLRSFSRSVDPDRLWQSLRNIPCDWKCALALRNFAQFLDRLASPPSLDSIFDVMLENASRKQVQWHPHQEFPFLGSMATQQARVARV